MTKTRETISNVGSKVEEKSKELAHKAENKAKVGESILQNQAYQIGAKARRYLNECEEKLEDSASYLESQIKARPFIATGAAVVIGMLISRFFRNNR